MKCPHCLTSFHSQQNRQTLGADIDGWWEVLYEKCPECKRFIVHLKTQTTIGEDKNILVHPKNVSRTSLPSAVDDPEVVEAYKEASLVLADSAKASAALSRRCLQRILREKAGVKSGDLFDEIQEVIDSGKLPSAVAQNLDAVRHIGAFAAHPIKSKRTGEIVDVEPDEAEWNLEVLEQLFDYYYVQPTLAKQKREKLNKKLQDVGKPLLPN